MPMEIREEKLGKSTRGIERNESETEIEGDK
jgi:hypothetical protein